MKKNLVPLMSVLALSAPALAVAENSNFNLYGQANVSYDVISTGTTLGAGAKTGISSSRISSNSSLLGVKGSSELDEDSKVIWQLEVSVGTDTGAVGGEGTGEASSRALRLKRLFDRNTFVGVTSAGMGTVLIGRHDTPYKLSTRKLDVFSGGIADNRSLLGTMVIGGKGGVVTEVFDTRLSNQILYMTPKISGFSGALGLSNQTESNTYIDQPSRKTISAAAMYDLRRIYATVAYEGHTNSQYAKEGDISTKTRAIKLGAGYRTGIMDAGFVYESNRDEEGNIDPFDAVTNPCGNRTAGSNCSGHKSLYLSLKFYFTRADTLKFALTKARQVGAESIDTGASQFALGFDHDFDKNTAIYGLYTVLKNDQFSRYGFSTAATSGVDSVNPTGTGGAEPYAFSFGLRHSF